MFRRRERASTAGCLTQMNEAPLLTVADPAVPMRACCCPARPMVKVVLPPVPGRPRPVDLWLCNHHYQASRVALGAAGARTCFLAPPAAKTSPAGAITATR